MTHGDKRHGTLFAALNVPDGTVAGRRMARHRHQAFISFLNAVERAVERAVPADKITHAIPDNSTTHAGSSTSRPPGVLAPTRSRASSRP